MSQWMIPYDKLDENQLQFIDEDIHKEKRIWIQGFAGSGKSVLLLHTVADIRIKEKDSKICIVVFTHSLKQLFIAGMHELNIKNIMLFTYYEFEKRGYDFDYIFCDEVQDLPPSILKKMKARSKKRLILSGDKNQSIYICDPKTKEAVVRHNEIATITEAKSYKLDTNYRLTKSILESVKELLPSVGENISSKIDKTKKNITPLLIHANSYKEEVEYLLNKAEESIELEENVLILLPTHFDIMNFINLSLELKNIEPWEIIYNRWKNIKSKDDHIHKNIDYSKLHFYLKKNNINIEYIGNGYGNLYENGNKKIILMTYHSAKGLDFDNVFLPFLEKNDEDNNSFFTDVLFMVGMTRTKKQLILSYVNNLHPYIETFKNICTKLNVNDIPTNKSSDELDDFDF